MRKLATTIIILCVLYFFAGWVAVQLGWLDEQKYFAYSGIVGGLASAAGLMSLIKPALTSADLQSIEVDALKSVTRVSEELKGLEAKRELTAAEVDNLGIKKKEMELLVRKASLALFMREQVEHHQNKINSIVGANSELRESLQQLTDVREKLAALNEEISIDPNSSLLSDVIESADRRQAAVDRAIESLPGSSRVLAMLLRDLVQAYVRLVRRWAANR